MANSSFTYIISQLSWCTVVSKMDTAEVVFLQASWPSSLPSYSTYLYHSTEGKVDNKITLQKLTLSYSSNLERAAMITDADNVCQQITSNILQSLHVSDIWGLNYSIHWALQYQYHALSQNGPFCLYIYIIHMI